MTSAINRRHFLATLPALAFVPRALAQSAGAPPMTVRGLSQLTLTVSDVTRSLEFYQGLFGMPIQARQGSMLFLRIGSGPQFLALRPAASGERPSISAFGMGVEGFDADRVMKTLAGNGVAPVESAGADGMKPGPMQAHLRVRRADAGGAADGTREIFVGDPSGIVFQLHDPSYCGGSGALGNVCQSVEPSPRKGLMAVRDMSHFTINASDAQKAAAFYQGLFGMPPQVYQATTPAYGVGPGVHFLMFTGGGGGGGARGRGAAPGQGGQPAARGGGGAPGAPPAPGAPGAAGGGDAAGRGAPGGGRGGAGAAPRGPGIDHACMGMDNFNPDTVTKLLTDYGLQKRDGASRDPLVTYISLRMPNRGGAPGGTPELYLTDPDGLAIQLQDVTYCGGAGFLGEVCPPL